MLTRDTQELLVSGVTFIVMGMFLGNLILIVLGLFPTIFLALGIMIGKPQEVTAQRIGDDRKIYVDGEVSDTIKVTVKGGVGSVTFSDILPNSFKLEEGTNFRIVWKGPLEKEAEISYRVTCAKRGRYELNDIDWETRHPLQITSNELGKSYAPRTFIVQPKPLLVKRIRTRQALTRIPMPMDARIKFGFPTTDFQEVRDYTPGDPYRNINWKVTARRLSASPGKYQVNEYEKEGKKVVWLFLDTASHMALGTTVKNTLEYSVRATIGFTDYYLSRECKVGLSIYDYDAHEWEGSYQAMEIVPELDSVLSVMDQIEKAITPYELRNIDWENKSPTTVSRILFPDLGKKQHYRILREMLKLDVGYGTESLTEAIHSCRGHIVGTTPMFIIITMIDYQKVQGLYAGIRQLYKYSGSLRRYPNIIIFNVLGYQVAAQTEEEKIAAELLEFRNRPVYEILKRMGATVVNWNPVTQSFSQALMSQRA
jgi:uncharacterized protein (DUF58 family)